MQIVQKLLNLLIFCRFVAGSLTSHLVFAKKTGRHFIGVSLFTEIGTQFTTKTDKESSESWKGLNHGWLDIILVLKPIFGAEYLMIIYSCVGQ